MNHGDDGFFSNDGFAVEEAVLDLRIDLLVDDLVGQVGDEEFDIAQQLVAGISIRWAG